MQLQNISRLGGTFQASCTEDATLGCSSADAYHSHGGFPVVSLAVGVQEMSINLTTLVGKTTAFDGLLKSLPFLLRMKVSPIQFFTSHSFEG